MPASATVYQRRKKAKWHASPDGDLGSATDRQPLEVTVQGDGGSSNGEVPREHGFGTQTSSTGSTDETSAGADIPPAAEEQHLEVTVQGDNFTTGESCDPGDKSALVVGNDVLRHSEEANGEDREDSMSISSFHGFGTQATDGTGNTDKTSSEVPLSTADRQHLEVTLWSDHLTEASRQGGADEHHLEVTVQGDNLTTESSNLGDKSALVIDSDVLRHSEEANDEEWEDSMSISSFHGFGTQATTGTGSIDETSSEAPLSTADGQRLEVAVRSDRLTEAGHQGGFANQFSHESALVDESMSDASFHGFSDQDTSTRNPDKADQGAVFSDSATSNGTTSDEDLQEDGDEAERGDEDENIFGNIFGAQMVIRQVPEVEVGNSPLAASLH